MIFPRPLLAYWAAALLSTFTTAQVQSYLIDSKLDRMGVNRMLVRAGVQEGDVVWIGDFSFEYQPDLR